MHRKQWEVKSRTQASTELLASLAPGDGSVFSLLNSEIARSVRVGQNKTIHRSEVKIISREAGTFFSPNPTPSQWLCHYSEENV